MEKQQTAIEWLIDKLTDEPYKFLFLSDKPEMNELIKLIVEAKIMEKEQMKEAFKLLLKAHVDWTVFSNKILDETFEDYYNETFKNK
jgi:hypothetical protein